MNYIIKVLTQFTHNKQLLLFFCSFMRKIIVRAAQKWFSLSLRVLLKQALNSWGKKSHNLHNLLHNGPFLSHNVPWKYCKISDFLLHPIKWPESIVYSKTICTLRNSPQWGKSHSRGLCLCKTYVITTLWCRGINLHPLRTLPRAMLTK